MNPFLTLSFPWPHSCKPYHLTTLTSYFHYLFPSDFTFLGTPFLFRPAFPQQLGVYG